MAQNAEKEIKTSTEFILYDVLDNIFANLSLKDLYRVACVSKSWYHIASKEISKRSDIQNFILPIVSNNDAKNTSSGCHIDDMIRSFPRLVFLFSGGERPHVNSIDDLYIYQCRCLERKTNFINIECSKVFMNEKQLCGENNSELGITVPSSEKLSVNYYLPDDEVLLIHRAQKTLHFLVEDAYNSLSFPKKEHNCFIFFYTQTCLFTDHNQRDSYIRLFTLDVLECLKQRYQAGTYSLWGGEVSNITTDFMGRLGIVASSAFFLRISGPAIKSWSIIFEPDLSSAEITAKFKHFKNNMEINNSTIALSIKPSNKNESDKQKLSEVEIFNTIFPKVPITTIFTKEEFFQIGTDSITSDREPVLEHENSTAFLIITTY